MLCKLGLNFSEGTLNMVFLFRNMNMLKFFKLLQFLQLFYETNINIILTLIINGTILKLVFEQC